jgi:hypothetical protein
MAFRTAVPRWFADTEEVTGSNPVAPTTVLAGQSAAGPSWSCSLHPWAAVGPRALLEVGPNGPSQSRATRVQAITTTTQGGHRRGPAHVMVAPDARNPAPDDLRSHPARGRTSRAPLPHRDPSTNRRATLCANRLSWSAGGRTWPQPPPERTPRQRPGPRPTSPLAQHALHRSNRAGLGQTTGRSRTRAGDHGKVARPKPWGRPAPTRSTRPRPRGQGGRGRETRGRETRGHGRPTADTPAHPPPDARTPDTGRADTGHRTRGHRTPGRGQATNGTASIRTSSTATTTKTAAGTANPSCGAGACGAATNDGSVMGHCERHRNHPATGQLLGVAPPSMARLGALLSCVGFGWYEKRAMGLRKGEECGVGWCGCTDEGVGRVLR